MALFGGQRQTPPEGESASQARPPRHIFTSFWRLCLTFFNAEKWELHEEELRDRKKAGRLFCEYLAIISLVMGLVLLMAVFKPSSNPLEARVQDWVMEWFAKTPNDFATRDFPQILFIDVDEASWRDERWGGGEPRAVPLRSLAGLIERAVELGAKYILTDFVVDGPTDEDMKAFYEEVKRIVDRTIQEGRDCRFLFVRSIREPLADEDGPPPIRPSFALDRLMAEYPNRVHGVSTNFVRTDTVVRHWRLWESACLGRPEGDRVWAVLPAAQLLIEALEREGRPGLRPIPWTPESLLARTGTPERPRPLTADEVCGRITADFQMGRWINDAFDRCYQQDHFTGQDCWAEKPDCERESAGLGKRANRVFFYWSDWYWEQGSVKRPFRHLYHVPARDLWRAPEAGGTGEAPETLKRAALFKKRVSTEQGGDAPPGIAIIGASYKASHDIHNIPRDQMASGPLILSNAMATMTLHGPIQEMGIRPSILVTLGIIVLFSASLTWATAWFGRWIDGWFTVRRERLVGWFRSRAGADGKFRILGLPVPEWVRTQTVDLASWTPDARIPAFWLVILLFFLLTWFLLAEWKIWFNFTLTISFMYCLLEIRSTAVWQALVLFALARLLL